MPKNVLIFFVIFSLIMPMMVKPVQAGVLDTGTSFSSCAAAGFITNKIKDGIGELGRLLQGGVGNLIKQRLGILGLNDRVPVIDEKMIGKYTTKEGAMDIIARCTAREILTKLGKDADNVARTGGRDGGPAFIRNWRNFQTDSQYRGEAIFRNILASTPVCNYFKPSINKIFNIQGKKDLGRTNTRVNSFDPFQLEAGCTLPAGFNMDSYKQDFEGNGGWSAWSRLLEPQNNVYGFLFKSMDEANNQRALEEKADENEAISGNGLTSIRGKNARDSCAVRGFNGQCMIYNDIKTPGNFVAGGVNARTQSEFNWITSSDELNEVIASALQVLVNRMFDFSNPNEGQYIVPGKISLDESQFPSGGGSGGGGHCSDTGGQPDTYRGDLQAAIGAVIANNPEGIADAFNTEEDSLRFLDFVAAELQGSGFNATTNVLNGNDRQNSGDLIALWRSGDTTAERYDAIASVGAGDMQLRDAAQATWVGDIPLDCAGGASGGGGGGSGGGENPTPAF